MGSVCPQGLCRAGGGGSGGAERGDRRWRRGLAGAVDRALGIREGGRLGDGAGGAFEGDEVQAVELAADGAPGLGALAFDDADQQERKPAEGDVRADPVLEAVEDGAQLEDPLEVAEAAFGFEQVLVAERDVFG